MKLLELFRSNTLAVSLLTLAITFAVLAATGAGNTLVFGLVALTNFFASIVFFMKGRTSDDHNRD